MQRYLEKRPYNLTDAGILYLPLLLCVLFNIYTFRAYCQTGTAILLNDSSFDKDTSISMDDTIWNGGFF